MSLKQWHQEAIELREQGYSGRATARILGRSKSSVNSFFQGLEASTPVGTFKQDFKGPKILFLDIELAPLRAALWSIWQQGVGLNQVESDWFILSFCGKWAHSGEVIYKDLRGKVSEEDDSELVEALFDLLNQADIVVAHNGRKFDVKKINARLLLNGFPKPSHYRVVDTLEQAKQQFSFTSNKLEYLTDKLCETKKSTHGKFAGYVLWSECLKDNPEAWDEMESYNKLDVLSLEELYSVLSSWDSKLPNYDVYVDEVLDMKEWEKEGFYYTNLGKYQIYRNKVTGVQRRSRINLLSKEKRKSLLANL